MLCRKPLALTLSGARTCGSGAVFVDLLRLDGGVREQAHIGRLDLGETYGRIRLTEVQRDYNDWCRDVNVRPLGKKAFTEELIKHRVTILTYNKQFVVAGRFSKE